MKGIKALSLSAAVLIPAPLMITSLASVYRDGSLLFPMLIWELGGICLLFLGRLTGSWVKKAGKKTIYAARTAAGAAGFLSAAVCIFFVYLTRMTSIAYMLMPAAGVFWYWLGYKIGLEREPVSNMVIGGYCIEAVFLFPMCCSLGENSFSANVIMVISAAVLVISAVLINRRQLVKLTFRGRSETAALSKDTRRFNLRLTLIFSALILVPFFFARWGGKWLWEIIKAIVRFLLRGFDWGEDLVTLVNDDDYTGEILEVPVNDTMWFRILMSILGAAIVILLAKPLIRAVSAWFRALGKKLGRLEDETAELPYIDFYEINTAKEQATGGFKKAYKAFLKEKDTNFKYRLGYKAFMIRLKELGEENLPSDTTSVHREKGSHVTDRDSVEKIVDRYERLRYFDGTATSEDCREMESILKSMAKIRRTVKSGKAQR